MNLWKKQSLLPGKNSPRIKVYCLPEEKQQIERNAKRVGLALSTYLLTFGIGYEPKGVVGRRLTN
ncbi:hypothetical protein [Methylomicrobium lacus]|uniref:plasmid mobilization protein n=1 Tax=Methylomicrobium lacus TaxID=136992 RepID=UPI0035A95CEC